MNNNSLLNGLVIETNEIRQKIDQAKAQKSVYVSELDRKNKELQLLVAKHQILQKAKELVNTVAEQTQQEVSVSIESLVTKALMILEDPYEFKVNFIQKRNKTEAKLSLERDGKEYQFFYGTGGGVADIVSFALRLTFWALKGDRRSVFIFDEPFKNLSKEYQPLMREFVEEFCREFNAQMIIVTHEEEWK